MGLGSPAGRPARRGVAPKFKARAGVHGGHVRGATHGPEDVVGVRAAQAPLAKRRGEFPPDARRESA
eukprot:382783-Lingulodinium_polyedra.AAC.1